MDEIIIKNVRCFYGEHVVPLRRLTFLVGENSTGKSTFLALTRLAWDLTRGQGALDFNEEPFELGSYDQIASLRGGRAGRAESFAIGASFNFPSSPDDTINHSKPEKVTVIGNFGSDAGSPKLRGASIFAGTNEVEVNYEEGGQPFISVKTPSSSLQIKERTYLGFLRDTRLGLGFLLILLAAQHRGENNSGSLDETAIKVLPLIGQVLNDQAGERPFAFAPIRTHPKRTYDPLSDDPRPEGSHVPMGMAKTATSDPKAWESMKQVLEEFGRQAGLFSELDVVRMGGDRESGPFQIRVKVSSHGFNLVDVGYGVSQVLPIIFDSIRQSTSTFLLQQPEVHMHPRAQAALGSFLAFLAKQRQKQFLIETHSDYILDRVRHDVRNKQIGADDVLILYFERENGGVRIVPIKLDDNGNVVGAPSTYRQFFMEEEMRVLAG